MIYYVKDYPVLQSGTLNFLLVTNEASKLNHDRSSSNFQYIFLIIYHLIYDAKDDPILQVSIQESSTSSKPPCNQKSTLSRSSCFLLEMDFLKII